MESTTLTTDELRTQHRLAVQLALIAEEAGEMQAQSVHESTARALESKLDEVGEPVPEHKTLQGVRSVPVG